MEWDEKVFELDPVSLEEVLDAREARAATRQRLIDQWKTPLVCFTLNIPGPHKVFPLAIETFEEGKQRILTLLKRRFGGGIFCYENRNKTGFEAFFGVDGDACEIKRMLLALEEGHPLGRLFDIDVYDALGTQLHRIDFGSEERKCLLCEQTVWACSRSRRHSADGLFRRVVQMMSGYFEERFAEDTAQKAVRALMTEVCITPKPGLVDRADNGAHSDMDLFTFVNSGCSLFPFFRAVTLFSLRRTGDAEGLLEAIRFHGILAEDAMLLATGGVNTHKGAIFSLGLLCAAAGLLYKSSGSICAETLFELCAKAAGKAVDELGERKGKEGTTTHGEAAFAAYRLPGIRGEVASGFASVQTHALPVFQKLRSCGHSVEEAGVVAMLHLIAYVDDTNIVSRSSLTMLREIQRGVRLMLREGKSASELIKYARHLNHLFIERHISPGGCADLLAVTIFVDSLCSGKTWKSPSFSFDSIAFQTSFV